MQFCGDLPLFIYLADTRKIKSINNRPRRRHGLNALILSRLAATTRLLLTTLNYSRHHKNRTDDLESHLLYNQWVEDGIGYYASLRAAPLNAFPLRSPRGRYQAFRATATA